MKKIISVILVFALAMSFYGCFKVNIVLPEADSVVDTAEMFQPSTEYAMGNTPSESAVASEPASSQAPVPSTQPTAPTETSTAPAPSAEASTVPAASQAPAAKKVNEMSKDEVVAFFNSTLNEVKAKKVGFKKSKLTSILDLNLSNSAANSLVGLVKKSLLSETAEDTSVNKGQSSDDIMSPSGAAFVSNITSADVSSFKVTTSGTNYVINIGIKDMNNPDKNSAYARIFDFMTVDDVVNIYAPKVGATVAREDIVVDFKGCYAELTVDANNKIVSYTTYVKGIMNMNNAKVKKVITIDTDVAVTLASTTSYTNFVY